MGPNNGKEPVPVQDPDGPTGYSLKYTNVAGQPNMTANWGRILSPVYAGENGLPTDDPAAGGTVTKRHWVPGSKLQHKWGYGYYGHSSYHGAYPSWEAPGTGVATGAVAFEGNEFYLQFRIKISASRFSAANKAQAQGSKLWFIDAAGWLANQQLVGLLTGDYQYWYKTVPWYQYTNRGSGPGFQGGALGTTQGRNSGGAFEPGGDWNSTCLYSGNTTASNACWEWPTDKWVTVLLRVKPGRHNTAPANVGSYTWMESAPFRETEITVQVQVEGDAPVYRTVYDKRDLVWVYGDYNTDLEDGATNRGWGGNFGKTGRPLPGFNQFAPTIYANTPDGAKPPSETYTYNFTQIIFSKSPIPCPQA